MINAEETKRMKAKELRYKKPIVKDLNIESIVQNLWDIQEACENVRWYCETDEETLINALDGDEDQAFEFKMMFSDLCAECERMFNDLDEEWVPDCFDIFFVSIGAGQDFGGILGYDIYEQDYFGIECSDSFAENEGKKTLKRLTKDNLIAAARQCFRIYQSYIALRYRYDCLKASMDILRDQNTGYLQMVKQIEELYEKANKETHGFSWVYGEKPSLTEFNRLLANMPQEAWIQ
jgi:hypothetical protein